MFGSGSSIVLDGAGNADYGVTVTVTGFSETGEAVVLVDSGSVSFANIDNCP